VCADVQQKEMCPVERIVVRSLPLPQPEATVVEPEELYQMYKKVLELQFDKHVAVLRDAIREQIRSSTVTLTTEQMHSCLVSVVSLCLSVMLTDVRETHCGACRPQNVVRRRI
jgi:hypothetical protein